MIVFVEIYYCYILYREIGTELEPIPTFLLLKCERMVVSRKLNELLTSYLDITSDISKPMILTKAKTMNADWQDFTKQGMYSNAQIYDSNHFTNTKLFLFHFKCSYTMYECMCSLKCLTYFFQFLQFNSRLFGWRCQQRLFYQNSKRGGWKTFRLLGRSSPIVKLRSLPGTSSFFLDNHFIRVGLIFLSPFLGHRSIG